MHQTECAINLALLDGTHAINLALVTGRCWMGAMQIKKHKVYFVVENQNLILSDRSKKDVIL